MRKISDGAARALSVLGALAAWQIAASAVGNRLLLVGPVTVAVRLAELCRSADFFRTVAFSFGHIAEGFALAFAVSWLLALLAGRFPVVRIILRPYMTAIKSVPVASFIILSLYWLSAEHLSVFVSFLMVLPILYTNLLSGICAADPKLLEMAKCYRVPPLRRFLYVRLPTIRPFLLSGCSAALGLSWKAGIAAEVIGIVTGSVGEKLYGAKVYLLTADLFAWTVVIVAVSVLFEKIVLQLLRTAGDVWERRG